MSGQVHAPYPQRQPEGVGAGCDVRRSCVGQLRAFHPLGQATDPGPTGHGRGRPAALDPGDGLINGPWPDHLKAAATAHAATPARRPEAGWHPQLAGLERIGQAQDQTLSDAGHRAVAHRGGVFRAGHRVEPVGGTVGHEASETVGVVAAHGTLRQLLHQRAQPVDNHHDHGGDLGLGGAARPPAAPELGFEVMQQPTDPFPVVSTNHAAHLGQASESLKGPIVTHQVQLKLIGRGTPGQGQTQGDQGGGGAAPGRAVDQQVALLRLPTTHFAALTVGIIKEQEGHLRPFLRRWARVNLRPRAEPVEGFEIQREGQRGRPRKAGARKRQPTRRQACDGHQALQVTAVQPRSSAPARAGRTVGGVEQLDRGAGVGGSRPRIRCLHGGDVVTAQAHVGPAGPAPIQLGGVRPPDDILGVGSVLHAQGDAHVGVGLDVLAQHPRGSLGSQDQMDTQASTPLGDAHQGVEKTGQLGGQRGELIDHHNQTGQLHLAPVAGKAGRVGGAGNGARGGTGQRQVGQVGDPCSPQHPLPIAELGLQAA